MVADLGAGGEPGRTGRFLVHPPTPPGAGLLRGVRGLPPGDRNWSWEVPGSRLFLAPGRPTPRPGPAFRVGVTPPQRLSPGRLLLGSLATSPCRPSLSVDRSPGVPGSWAPFFLSGGALLRASVSAPPVHPPSAPFQSRYRCRRVQHRVPFSWGWMFSSWTSMKGGGSRHH